MPLPEQRIREIVARFPAQWASKMDQSLQSLPDPAKTLLGWTRLHLLPAGHPDVPADLARTIARAAQGSMNGGVPSCCHRAKDGTIFIVLGDEPHNTLPHELIHAGQCVASPDAMDRAFHHLMIEGEALVMACRDAVRAGRPADDFRDLTWCRQAIGGTFEESRPAGARNEALLSTFGLHILLHPRDAVAEIGRQMRFEHTGAIAAVVFAYYLGHNRFHDSLSDVARELVAYRFENDLVALEDLFLDACGHAGLVA